MPRRNGKGVFEEIVNLAEDKISELKSIRYREQNLPHRFFSCCHLNTIL